MLKWILPLLLLPQLGQGKDPVDECLKPGEVISRSFSHLQGDPVEYKFSRAGKSKISQDFEFTQNLRTIVYSVYKEIFCEKKSYSKQIEKCELIERDVALGHGNAVFKSFFDARTPLARRSSLFARKVDFALSWENSQRLALANDIVKEFVNWMIQNGSLPKGQHDYREMIQTLVEKNILSLEIADELVRQRNLSVLGLVPPKGVQITEGTGNDLFFQLFDFRLSIHERARLVKENLKGGNFDVLKAKEIANHLILFANTNGVPESWDQFILMFQYMVQQRVISENLYKSFLNTNEFSNREVFGFQIEAKICKMETIWDHYNKVSERATREFNERSEVKVTLTGSSAPILSGENENFEVSYNGVTKPQLRVQSRFNTYNLTDNWSKSRNESISFSATGKRKQVSPANTLEAQLIYENRSMMLNIRDKFLHPEVLTGTTVEVEVFEKRPLWFDKKIKTLNLALTSSQQSFSLNVTKPRNNKVYARIRLKRESVFFNRQWSRQIKTPDLN